MKWTGHVGRKEGREMYTGFWLENLKKRKSLRKLSHRSEYNIKMDIKKKGKAWTRLIWLGTDRSGELLWTRHGNEPSGSTKHWGFFRLTQEIFACQEKLCSMEFVMRHTGRIYAMQTTNFLYEIIRPVVRFHPHVGLQMQIWSKIKVAKKKNSVQTLNV